MNRSVPWCTACLLLCLAGAGQAVAASGDGSKGLQSPTNDRVISTAEVRMTVALARGWRFLRDDSLTEDAALVATGASWQEVSLPHTWNAIDAASTTATTPYKRGPGWYRLAFKGPLRGVRHWLQFDGASIVADVWLNGKKLGQHKGAFTAFRFDVTNMLRAGENALLVRTDNSAPKTDMDPTAIAPLGGDFNMSGGLYRDVSLVSTIGDAHLGLDDFASSGVFGRTASVTSGIATVNVRARLTNDSNRDGAYVVRAALVDAGGRLAGLAQKGVSIDAGTNSDVAQDIVVPHARLWQGISDPYLYKLVVELADGGGAVMDRVVQDFGIRQMSFDPNDGFFLNGTSTPLHGVAMHQDHVGKGWAISERDTDASLALIKELGANTVRLAHYPHSQYTLRQADKLGLVVWAEVPFVNGSTLGCSTADATSAFMGNLKQQLQELIRQQYNHASIAVWSIGNETTMSQTMGCGGKTGKDNVTPVLRELQAVARAEDSSRATTMADLNEGMLNLGGFIPVGGISDTWALNRYFMWYYGASADELGRNLDELHAKYPRQPIGVSEYGAGAALSDHTDNPLGGPVGSFNMGVPRVYQPEEYAAYVHEQNYGVLASRKYVWGTYLWNMFDFGSGIRNEGDLRGVNTKGLVTFDRLTKKDPFFFYQANWSGTPVTYIVGRRYTNRAYAVADVKVYSNAESVRLSVNDKDVATMTPAQCPLKTCVFGNVALQPGANRVVARGTHGRVVVTDRVEWTLVNANDVNIAAGQLTTGFTSSAGALYGSDNFFRGGTGHMIATAGLRAPSDATPVRGVADAKDAGLYAAYRSGTFRYDIPLANGSYRVTLGFLEPGKATTAGGRVFSVEANGERRIANLDILGEAGAYRTAVTRSFTVTVTHGRLELVFVPTAGEAVVSNITIGKE
ncbi:MAG TPA: glycoside hydrolase family 2 TIM barrel-domain containing protein [Vicinamibacterales bacterium]